jgi:hypothetical protein
MTRKITTLLVSLNKKNLSSMRLPIEGTMYTHRCFIPIRLWEIVSNSYHHRWNQHSSNYVHCITFHQSHSCNHAARKYNNKVSFTEFWWEPIILGTAWLADPVNSLLLRENEMLWTLDLVQWLKAAVSNVLKWRDEWEQVQCANCCVPLVCSTMDNTQDVSNSQNKKTCIMFDYGLINKKSASV